MARPWLPEPESSYYPPRARWYSVGYYPFRALCRRLSLDRLRLPTELTTRGLIAAFLVPGLGVWLRGPRLWGRAALGGAAALILFFLAGLGYPAANFAFGLLISLHVTGLVYYCQPMLGEVGLLGRLRFTFLMLVGVGLLLYLPVFTHIVDNHWLTPLRLSGRVFVVQRLTSPGHIQRGDWVAYALHESEQGPHGDVVWVQGGMSLGPVLAVAGDRVEFGANSFTINGVARPTRPYMPTTGEFLVPENHWFIWPNLDISGHGNVQEASIRRAILELADVNEAQFYGKPFHRWFGRKQMLP
jgi:hypothetical protein